MTEQNYSDPLKMWKQLYDVNEKYWGKVMNDVVHKEEFSEWMGSVLDFNLFMKKTLNDQSKVFFEASNFPSKEDIASVANLVINVEGKVDDIEEQLFNQNRQEIDFTTIKKDLSKMKTETKAIQQEISELKASLSNIEQLLLQLTTKK